MTDDQTAASRGYRAESQARPAIPPSKSLLFVVACGSASSATASMLAFFLGVSVTLVCHRLPDWHAIALITTLLVWFSIRCKLLYPIAWFALGFCWAVFSFTHHSRAILPESYERVDFVLTGQVVGLPEQRGSDVKFRFLINRIDSALPLEGLLGHRIQLSCYRCPKAIKADQRWRFTVRLKRPHSYASWGAFDYQKFQFRHQYVARGYVRESKQAELLGITHRSINGFRESLKDRIEKELDVGIGRSMILALVIGDKSGFSAPQRQTFQITGVAHLMAISGLHVGLVFMVVKQLMTYLLWPIARFYIVVPRPSLVLWPALLAAVLYSALAGFAVSTQRALIMLLVYVVCRLLGSRLSLTAVLLRAIVVLLLLDPFSVLDTGFWLSCGAVWIIAISTRRQSTVSLVSLQPKLWVGMLPMSSLFFAQVSLVSPLVNLILVPVFCIVLIPATLLSVTLFLAGNNFVSIWALQVLSTVYELVYALLESLATKQFASAYTLPLTYWHWILAASTACAAYARSRAATWLALLLVISIVFNPFSVSDETGLRVTLLDVGQGLSMVVESGGQVLVYDVGPKYASGFSAANAVLLPYLRTRGIVVIDTLIISHADMDHIGGLSDLRAAFAVQQSFSSRLDKVSGAEACTAGYAWQMGDTHLRFISPSTATPTGSNNRSCVLMLEHAGVKVLLTRDIEKQVERYLIRNGEFDLSADILLVPHQGSKTSSTNEFVGAVSPKLALVAAGYLNHYGHPHPEVLQRYQARDIKVMSTVESGSLLVEVGNDGWRVSSYRDLKQRFWHYQKVSKPVR